MPLPVLCSLRCWEKRAPILDSSLRLAGLVQEEVNLIVRKPDLVGSLEEIVEKRRVNKNDLGSSVRDLKGNLLDSVGGIGTTKHTSTSCNTQVRNWTEYMVGGKHHNYFTLSDLKVVKTQAESLDPTQGLFG